MTFSVSFVLTKKHKISPNLTMDFFMKNGAIYEPGSQIAWKSLTKKQLTYLFSVFSKVSDYKNQKFSYVKLTEDQLVELLSINIRNNDFFINESVIALEQFDDFDAYAILINTENEKLLESLPLYKVENYDLSDTFMLINDSGNHHISHLQASRLLINMRENF